MGDMTKNFSRAEFTCKCGCGSDDVNPKLVNALQKLRDKAGRAIIINDAVRCPKHNAEVGGVRNSQHILGSAADIRIEGMAPSKVADLAETIPEFANCGIGRYKTFTHVDVRGHRARWNG